MNQLSITTHSGRRISLTNPNPDFINIDDIAHGLAYQCRFNGQTTRFYSVAQHSLMVASLLPDHLKLVGLLHDAAEAYLGDMVQPLKVLLPEFADIENCFLVAIGQRFRVNLTYSPEVKNADLIALATEKRDLLPKESSEWPLLSGINPIARLTLPMTPQEAKDAFIKAFLQFQGSRLQKPHPIRRPLASARLFLNAGLLVSTTA